MAFAHFIEKTQKEQGSHMNTLLRCPF